MIGYPTNVDQQGLEDYREVLDDFNSVDRDKKVYLKMDRYVCVDRVEHQKIDDELLSILTFVTFEEVSKEVLQFQTKEIFKNNNILLEFVQNKGFVVSGAYAPQYKGVCGKIIRAGEIVYHCRDCAKDRSTFICVQCFENENHTNHKFEVIRNPEKVMCDCGDIHALQKSGFCKDHDGIIPSESAIFGADIDDSVKKAFEDTLKKLIYYTCTALEKTESKYNRTGYSNMLYIVLFYLTKAIENNKDLSVLIGTILITPYNEYGQNKYQTNHDCDWVGDFTSPNGNLKEKHTCKCTPLRQLIRVNRKMTRTCQNFLNSFFLQLFTYEKFKEIFAQEYLLCIKMMFYYDKISNGSKHGVELYSELFNLCIQVMATEQYSLEAVKKSKLTNLLEVIEQFFIIGKKPYLPTEVFLTNILFSIRWVLMTRECINIIFLDSKCLEKLLKIFEKFYEIKFDLSYTLEQNVDLNLQNVIIQTMKFEVSLISMFNEMMSQVISGCDMDIDTAFHNFMKELQKSILRIRDYSNLKASKNLNNQGKHIGTFVLPLERIYIESLVSYIYFSKSYNKIEVTDMIKTDLQEFREDPSGLKMHKPDKNVEAREKQYFKNRKEFFRSLNKNELDFLNVFLWDGDVDKKEEFWNHMTKCFAQSAGVMRSMTCKNLGFYGPQIQDIQIFYHDQKFFKIDVVALQFCAMNNGPDFFPLFKKEYFDSVQILSSLKSKTERVHYFSLSINNVKFMKEFVLLLIEVLTNSSYLAFIIDSFVYNIKHQCASNSLPLNEQ